MIIEARVDRLIEELTVRYGNRERFLERLRPMLHTIFSPEISEQQRTDLLELVAETCVRDAEIQENCDRARQAYRRFFDHLIGQMEEFSDFVRRSTDRRNTGEQHGADGTRD